MFARSNSRAMTNVLYGELTHYTACYSSVLRWLQKQESEDKSRTAAGREFQAAGPQTAN